MRVVQKSGEKGSLKWIQTLINEHPEILDNNLRETGKFISKTKFNWLSPLKNDDFAEYRDKSFLDLLEITPQIESLNSFWPKKGPQWDALGKTNDGKIILIEAKSHINEVFSPESQASKNSLDQIRKSLKRTQSFLGANSEMDWSKFFYQYTNRLSHLYFLNEVNKIQTYLIFIYFIEDLEMNGPKNESEWKAALKVIKYVLGLQSRNKLDKFILDIFINVNSLS